MKYLAILMLTLLALVQSSGPVTAAAEMVRAAGPASASNTVQLELNTATLEQLVAVRGIGPRTAGLILELRAGKGAFSSVEELLEVDGIGEKRLAALVKHLKVAPPTPVGGTAVKK